jgi:multidrug efflux pump subunit AcrA (membrane-fusion protein)
MDVPDEQLLSPPQETKLLPPASQPAGGVSHRARYLLAGAFVAILLAFFLLGYLPRRNRERVIAAQAEREAEALPTTNVVKVRQAARVANLLLPGSIVPLTEAYIYARATGYVKRRYADIGDRVREGQLLADIEAPDLDAQVWQAQAQVAQADQQLAQARAALENAQAQVELARVTWDRYRVLVEHGAVSRQDADQQLATYKSDEAQVHLQEAAIRTAEENVRASRANLEHEVALQSFERVRAPFTGVVTARNFDVGALVSASGASQGLSTTPLGGTQSSGAQGNAGANGSSPGTSSTGPGNTTPTSPGIGNSGELYRIAQIGTVRILVDVPQENAPALQIGQSASVFVQEFSKTLFTGRLTRTTSELNQTTRTLVAEVDAPNPRGQLLPGMYAQVQFADRRSSPPLLIPGDSAMETSNGMEVAILVDPDSRQKQQLQQQIDEQRKHYGDGKAEQQRLQEEDRRAGLAKRIKVVKVDVGRDYGTEIEITQGLSGWEYVVVNPGDNVRDGALVVPRAAPPIAGESDQPRHHDAPQSGIGAPSMAAPTGGAAGPSEDQNGGGNKGGNKKGSNSKKASRGESK